jgi:hypothetical protein
MLIHYFPNSTYIISTKENIYRTVLIITNNTQVHTYSHTHTRTCILFSTSQQQDNSYPKFLCNLVPVRSVIFKQSCSNTGRSKFQKRIRRKKRWPRLLQWNASPLLKQTLATKNKITDRRIYTRYTWRYVKSRSWRYDCWKIYKFATQIRCMLLVQPSWFVFYCIIRGESHKISFPILSPPNEPHITRCLFIHLLLHFTSLHFTST